MENFQIRPTQGTSLYQKASIDTAYALVWSVVLAVGVWMKKDIEEYWLKTGRKIVQLDDIQRKPPDIIKQPHLGCWLLVTIWSRVRSHRFQG